MESLKVLISTIEDISKITKDTKYICLDITKSNYEVISYFIKNGQNYLYSSAISNTLGYVYVNHHEFVKAETIISLIYANMPKDLTELEVARYLYISIAKYVSFDINSSEDKNETRDMFLVTNINNIWGSLSCGKITNLSIAWIYYYLCRRLSIETSIVIDKETGEILNKLVIDNQIIVTNLFKDLPYIQANMKTKYFGPYNNETNMDKKIHYIKNKYNDDFIDKAIKDIDYLHKDCVFEILKKTEKIINVEKLKPSSLNIIYQDIFHKYCPNYDIKINNLFLNKHDKSHFIMISYSDMHYSYNYKNLEFVKVNNNDILYNIKSGKIGIYLNEYIPNININ